jgi:hypothetical protein
MLHHFYYTRSRFITYCYLMTTTADNGAGGVSSAEGEKRSATQTTTGVHPSTRPTGTIHTCTCDGCWKRSAHHVSSAPPARQAAARHTSTATLARPPHGVFVFVPSLTFSSAGASAPRSPPSVGSGGDLLLTPAQQE